MNKPLKPSDVIKDNDPRMPNRKLLLHKVDERFVYARNMNGGTREYRILRNRVYTDTKERRTGFSRL